MFKSWAEAIRRRIRLATRVGETISAKSPEYFMKLILLPPAGPIPETLGALSKLEMLWLATNKLSGKGCVWTRCFRGICPANARR